VIKLETTLDELHQLDEQTQTKSAKLRVSTDLVRRLLRDHRKMAAEVEHEDPES
jgi:DNA helicase HerA-like ATPase